MKIETEKKPIHVKPNLYTYFMESMKIIAKEHGYNLLVHGSMNRDLDLIAVPWIDNPKPELELVQELHKYLNGTRVISSRGEEHTPSCFTHSVLAGGRSNYTISMARHGEWNNYEKDLEYYLDISFTPLGIGNMLELIARNINTLKKIHGDIVKEYVMHDACKGFKFADGTTYKLRLEKASGKVVLD